MKEEMILIIIVLSCSKNISRLKDAEKGINENLIKYLIKSCEKGDKEKVIELLNMGANANFKDVEGIQLWFMTRSGVIMI